MILAQHEKFLATMNAEGNKFWHERTLKMTAQLDNPAVVKSAVRRFENEQARQISIYHQTPLDLHLDLADKDFAETAVQVQIDRARDAQSRKPRDELTKIIDAQLAKHPSTTEAEMLELLKAKKGPGAVILDVDDDEIAYVSSTGCSRILKTSNLKDRLSRAKKKLTKPTPHSR